MITGLSNIQIFIIIIIIFLLAGYIYYINCESSNLINNNLNTKITLNSNNNHNNNSNNSNNSNNNYNSDNNVGIIKNTINEKKSVNSIIKKNNIKRINKNVSFLLPQTEQKKNVFYLNKNMEYDDGKDDDLNVSLLPQGTMFVHP
jgi:lipopolysaccharide export LptBFGC system permease protein LptF